MDSTTHYNATHPHAGRPGEELRLGLPAQLLQPVALSLVCKCKAQCLAPFLILKHARVPQPEVAHEGRAALLLSLPRARETSQRARFESSILDGRRLTLLFNKSCQRPFTNMHSLVYLDGDNLSPTYIPVTIGRPCPNLLAD